MPTGKVCFNHYLKSASIRSFPAPHFAAFRLNTAKNGPEILRIRTFFTEWITNVIVVTRTSSDKLTREFWWKNVLTSVCSVFEAVSQILMGRAKQTMFTIHHSWIVWARKKCGWKGNCCNRKLQKQSFKCVLRKRCSENMQQFYRQICYLFSKYLFLRLSLEDCFWRWWL